MNNNEIYKKAAIVLLGFCVNVALARFTNGATLLVLALLGVVWAFNGKTGRALSVEVMILSMVVLNPFILSNTGMLSGIGLRVGPLLIGLALAFNRLSVKETRRLPLGMMLVFLVVAAISSATGWSPRVSYMKLVNFLIFFLGVWLGTQGLEKDSAGLMSLRATYIALAAFFVVGSIAVIPFPGISTMRGLRAAREIDDLAYLNALAYDSVQDGGLSLLCGVTLQSQALSPLLVSFFAVILCDMLFVEEKFRVPHVALLLCTIPLLYMTRSRVGLLGIVVTLGMIYFYLPKKVRLDIKVRKWLGVVLSTSAVCLAIIVAVMEIRNDAMSKWVRKTNNVETDRRSITEAFSSSRQGLIDLCIDDYKRNPLLGMGFQVAFYTEERLEGQKGLILSSPIEKGILPLMVLGETGIIGSIIFWLFMISYIIGANRRRLYVSLTMMIVYFTINLGEATFFSPGGAGGIEWLVCLVGGYVVDLKLNEMQRHRFLLYGNKYF